MLSSPRKPPPNRLLPSGSWRLSHHVKLTSSFWNTRSRNSTSLPPSMTNTRSAARACTGGLTSSKFHSYAGSAPLGCWNHSRSSTSSWYLAKAGSRWAHGDGVERRGPRPRTTGTPTGPAWPARRRSRGAASRRCGRRGARRRRRLAGVAVEPAADPVRVDLLAPDQPGARLAEDPHALGVGVGGSEGGVELVGLGPRAATHVVERRPARPTVGLGGRVGVRPVQAEPELGACRRRGR